MNMKNTILFIALSFLIFSCEDNSKVVVGQKTSMEVNLVFDAGTVVNGEVINAKFKVKNTGKYPLVFGEVRPSCSCTVPHKPEKPIQPGETGEIVAQVMTDKLNTKNVSKSVTIMTNTEPNKTVLMIKAVIK
jgi:hypothetical protein